jgi:hypothetical protein
MPSTILMRATPGRFLRPLDEIGEETIARFGNRDVKASLTMDRSGPNHRHFMALMATIYKGQSRFRSFDDFMDFVKMSVGHFKVIHLSGGRSFQIPKSISFGELDELAFRDFKQTVIDQLIVEQILPRLDDPQIEREILEFIDR